MSSSSFTNRVLFIRNIPRHLDDKELDLFRNESGFVDIRKITNRDFIFVEYKTVDDAKRVMEKYQNYKFKNSDRGIYIEYDKRRNSSTSDSIKKRKSPNISREEEEPDHKRQKRDKSNVDNHDSAEKDPKRYSSPRYSPEERKRSVDSERSDNEKKKRHSVSPYRRRERDRYLRRIDDRRRPPPPPGYGYPPPYPDYYYPPMYHHPPPPPPRRSIRPNDKPVTLFVSNLPKDTTERELSIVFRLGAPFGGLRNVRLIPKDGRTIAFIDFLDSTCAHAAMDRLKGFRFDIRDPTGIHIEFDKGQRKP